MDTARGNQTLFMRRDEVFAAWDLIDPVIDIIKDRAPSSTAQAPWVRPTSFLPMTGGAGSTPIKTNAL